MTGLIESPLFGILLSLLAFELGMLIYRTTKWPLLNGYLISVMLVIAVLTGFRIDLQSFNRGGQVINFFLGPATVVLAVPLYRQIKLLKANIVPILVGITAGSLTGIVSIIGLAKLFGLSHVLSVSLIPKSVTTPIGLEISREIGGIPAITVAAIIITGIVGAVIGPIVCRVCRIHDQVAVGAAIGTSAHAIGTTKALELGEIEGAISGLTIGIAGLITVFLAPVLVRLL